MPDTIEEICKQFVKICETGTSHDCTVFVAEAKRKGVSYETLCEYKRKNKKEDK